MNIALLLDLVADILGDRVGLTDASGHLTYDELRALARSAAAQLTENGTRTLAFADVNSAVVPTALFGAAWAGVSYAPLNFRLPAESLRAQIARLDRPFVVAGGELSVQLGDSPGQSSDQWSREVRSAVQTTGATYLPEPGGAAVILFTSGSSGAPKAALLSHENLASYIMQTVEFAAAGEDEALILAAPPFHIAGVAAVLSSVYSGRRILPLATFTPEGWLEGARSHGATHAFLVPTMLARIVQAMESDPSLTVPTLRSISYGGASMAAPILERALVQFLEVDFVNAYGLTETSSTIAVLGPEDHRDSLASADPAVRRRLRSVGRPLPGVDVAILGEGDLPAPPETVGPIRVRGRQVGGEYLDTASSLDTAGWLVTGDVGFIDDAGYLFVEGRADDVIIKGGENLSPSEIEDVLLRHDSVEAVVVVGIPDPEWGETVAAAVVIGQRSDAPGPDRIATMLQSWVREQLGSLKTPTRVELFEELPATGSGKVLRRAVRDQLARTTDETAEATRQTRAAPVATRSTGKRPDHLLAEGLERRRLCEVGEPDVEPVDARAVMAREEGAELGRVTDGQPAGHPSEPPLSQRFDRFPL